MSWMQSGGLCFDIGANVGATADLFIRAGAHWVIAVEPCIENYLVLCKRKQMTAILAAAWSKPGIMEVAYAFNEPGLSSVQPAKWGKAYSATRWGEPQPVVTITLDMLWEKYGKPFLIKIDVEGSEREVLLGLSQPSPFLTFEFHAKFFQDAVDCLALCQKLGYTKAHYVRENLNLETVPTMTIDEFRPRWLADAPEWGNITVC